MSIRTAIPSDKEMTNKGIANFVGIGGRSKKDSQRRHFNINMCLPAENGREKKKKHIQS